MHLFLRLCALVALPLFVLVAPAAAQKGDYDVVKMLDEWLGDYTQGELDVSKREKLKGKTYQAKQFVSVRRGLTPEHEAGRLSYEAELRLICAAVAKRNDAAAANVLLKVACVGLEQKQVDAALVPSVVRAIGQEFASKLTSTEALQTLVATARGDGGKSNARQGAALRVLALSNAGAQRQLLEQMLGHGQPEVRMAAAEALGIGAQPLSVAALGVRLDVEADERVATLIVDALTATVAAAGTKIEPSQLSAALDAAIVAYGKHGWRYQIAAIDFFAAARSARTVPVLIDTLARYHGKDGPPAGDKASGLIPARAHHVLRSLTKCVFPEDRPEQWAEWWKENQTTLKVEAAAEPVQLGRPAQNKATVTSAFFGIPVAGSRVVFVVDISGSMHFPLVRHETTSTDTQYSTKWQLAHAELKGAIERLGADCSFNVIFFSTGAEAWKPKLVPASAGNKKAFLAHLDKVNPNGGTNVWAGLQLALNPKSMDPTVRVAADLDELFVLSDGLPSVGDVVDPKHILLTVQTVNEVSKIRVNTVYIGGDEDQEQRRGQFRWDMDGPEFMRKLATENGGAFLQK